MDDTYLNLLNLPDTHLKSKLILLHVIEKEAKRGFTSC